MLSPGWRSTVVLVALALAALGQPFLPAAHAEPAPATGKGPVGWDAYRHLERLPELTTGVSARQFSSFDRGGANGDFWNTLSHADDGYVLAEHQGPGEITSIWSTREEGDVRATGKIRVTLDGKTVLNAPLQDVVDGKLGAPFVFPVVGNASQSSGGVYVNAPMPFQRSMRVTTDVDPTFYNIATRTFADASGVATFDPADQALDVVAQLAAAGTRDPKSASPGATTTARSTGLPPGQSAELAALTGPGTVSALRLRIPQLTGPPTPSYLTDDGRAFGGDDAAHSQFTVAVDPANQGVRLTRRFNPTIGLQRADIYVDDVKVAAWAPLPAKTGSLWQDQSVDLPASATEGKAHITIRNAASSASGNFNEYTYWVDSLVAGRAQRTDTVDVGPQHTAEESAHDYSIAHQTSEATRVAAYPPSAEQEAAVTASGDVLQGVRLRVTADGQRTVDAPLGEFFGAAQQLSTVRSLMVGMDPATRTLSAWWSMPYAGNARVELYNGSRTGIEAMESEVTAAADPQTAARLGPSGNLGYFRATSHRAATTPGEDYPFLQASGWGKFVGVTHTMIGPATRGHLEGDERVYVDGSRSPQIHGTGAEDFYQGGWYFNRGTFTGPTHGNPTHEAGTAACPADCTGAYRLMLADAVPFSTSLNFGIEHGPVNEVAADYSSTAYWYGRPAGTLRSSDTLDLGNPASEQAHQFRSGDAARSLTATYEGNDGVPAPLTDPVRTGHAEASFTLRLDPVNTGVTLRRTSDQQRAGQSAQVYVDGQDAGAWRQPLGNPFHRWLDDTFALPPGLTQGKSQITIRVVPTRGPVPFSAGRYEALNTVAPFLDQSPPAAVTGLGAVRLGNHTTNVLTWQRAGDDVGVDHYAVYGSTDPAFTPGPATLLGTSPVRTFTHAGLGPWQLWFYRVVAVDAAGNAGAPSAWAAAFSGLIPAVATRTTILPTPNPVRDSATVLFALVDPTLVLGTVSFTDADRPVPGCTGRPVVLGYAYCVTTFTTAGAHPLAAVYSGDGLHTGSTGFSALNISADRTSQQFALGLFLDFVRGLHLFGL